MQCPTTRHLLAHYRHSSHENSSLRFHYFHYLKYKLRTNKEVAQEELSHSNSCGAQSFVNKAYKCGKHQTEANP